MAEFTAIAASVEFIADKYNHKGAKVMLDAINYGISEVLNNGKWPSRKVNELDTRGEHFYFALYWAKALAEQDEIPELKEKFSEVYKKLSENEAKINEELLAAQGRPADIDGYYFPDEEKAAKEMRPSPTLNAIIDSI